MIQRLLVANRAEIAGRVFRTCRRLGIETVAIHSDADAALPYVREADIAVRLPGNPPTETYLRIDLVLAAALKAGADAIHPGYGFLSENAEFARAVLDAGLTWVGPDPASIEQMGSKIESKRLMADAGVPVLTNHTVQTATEADLPLVVKAAAGGGGRGMRIVRTLGDLPGEIDGARAEAASAFGDGTVFVEPYVEPGRHVEVQVVGHTGGVLVYGERDCSIQRRHQKVIEEGPAPGLSEEIRCALQEAAHAAAAAIDYRGAGTVEFLVDASDPSRFWFLEMNTRLQVEHPVTEAVFGVDLVELQLAVAEGQAIATCSITETGAITEPRGHAIEARLYAEDPDADYRPESGVLSRFEIPGGDGIRVDAGFESGSEVSTYYDAMLAKVIAHAPTREQAARKLRDSLRRAHIHGLVTNRDLLVEVLGTREFLAGEVSTGFLGGVVEVGQGGRLPGSADDQARALFAAAMAWVHQESARQPVQRGIPLGWRNVPSAPQIVSFDAAGTTVDVGWTRGRHGIEFHDVYAEVGEVRLVSAERIGAGWRVVVEQDGVSFTHEVHIEAERVDVDSSVGHFVLTRIPRFVDPADAVASGSLLAPMPGTVVRVEVEAGQQVEAGQAAIVLEAMKMQHTVAAPHSGTVTALPVVPGQQVTSGDVLAVVQEEDV